MSNSTRFSIAAASVLFLLSADDHLSGQELPASEVVAKSIEARKRIKTFHAEIAYTYTSKERNEEKRQEIWLDGTKIRFDRYDHSMGGLRKFVDCNNCLGAGMVFVGDDMPNVAKHLGRATWSSVKDSVAFDPRLLGLSYSPYSTLRHGSFEKATRLILSTPLPQIVRDSKRTTVQVIGSNEFATGIATFDIEKQYSILRIETLLKGNPKQPVTLLECSEFLSFGPKADPIFFPTKITYTDFKEDGTIQSTDSVTLSNLEINQPIDPEVFTIKGMKLGDNFYVQNEDRSKSGVFRGGRIVPNSEEKARRSPDETPVVPPQAVHSPRAFDWIYIVALALVFVGGTLLLMRWLGNRSRKSP